LLDFCFFNTILCFVIKTPHGCKGRWHYSCMFSHFLNQCTINKIYNVPKFQLFNKSPTKDFFIVITMQVLYGSICFTIHRRPSILEFCGVKLDY
jgi:hypothetical protein